MKVFALALLTSITLASACPARAFDVATAGGFLARVDWQEPPQLPPRYRNYCRVEKFTNRPYCSDHCGADYQFYFCAETSFGCCHLGRGYCDFNGLLRCHP